MNAQLKILTPDARDFITQLARQFGSRRLELLQRRKQRDTQIRAGAKLDFLAETASVRASEWRVAPTPADINDRRVEITGPVDAKMIINALNSGAKVFMADFEDSNSPTWENNISGQQNLIDAIRRTLKFKSPEGKEYKLVDSPATLMLRPRGWHLVERGFEVDGAPISGSLFDFGLFFFHNAKELLARGSAPYFYLPKLESHLEARLWNDVFTWSQKSLGIPHGSVRATVLIETILAAFEMDEILYELRDHAAGLNAGRWDYIFSAIKKFSHDSSVSFPDRAQITMTVPFMRAYSELLVKTCHRRGAHAIGGMSAFIPSRRDSAINETALARVREDKKRESNDGFDGTWVAHPDLVPIARAEFDQVLGDRPNQKEKLRADVSVQAANLTNFAVPGGQISEAGVRNNISVALQYIESWLRGTGAVAIFNLMEDAATAEISRAELWSWIKHSAKLADGRALTQDLYKTLCLEEQNRLEQPGRYDCAAGILNRLVLSDEFEEFLTIPAYAQLDR